MNAHSKIDHETLVNMTSEGHVPIPKALRDHSGLIPNGPVRVGINDRGETVILPTIQPRGETPEQRKVRVMAALRSLAGTYATGQTTDEIMRDIRGDWEP